MAQFKFRLDSLLRLRLAKRDERREALAEAYRADQILRQQQQDAEQEIEETRRISRANSASGDVSVDRLLNNNRYELIMKSQIQRLGVQREQIAEEISRRRQALVEADQELRILEKLRERHAAEFQYHEEKSLIRDLDEIALRNPRD